MERSGTKEAKDSPERKVERNEVEGRNEKKGRKEPMKEIENMAEGRVG